MLGGVKMSIFDKLFNKKNRGKESADSKDKQPKFIPQKHLAEQLQVGMSLDEIVRILGPSTASIGGGEVVSMTQDIGATIPGALGNMMGCKTFMEWERPEGIYKLVIENNRLARIFTVPDK
jgi:hypothetical protein